MDYYRYRNRQGVAFTDDQTIVFLDLTKLNDVTQRDVSEMTGVEMWLLFLKHISDESKKNVISQIVEKREGIKMAIARLQEISADEATRVQYERGST